MPYAAVCDSAPIPQARARAARGCTKERAFPDGACCRMLMEDLQMTLFEYSFSTDALRLSLALADGTRETRLCREFKTRLPSNPAVALMLRQSVLGALAHYAEQPRRGSLSLCLDLYQTGCFRWYLAQVRSLGRKGRGVERVIGSLRDVQAEKLSELRLQNLRMYRRAVDFASLFVYEFDLPDYRPRMVSHREGDDDCFYEPERYLAGSEELIHPDDLGIYRTLAGADSLLAAYRAQQYELRAALRLLTQKGVWVWVQITIHLSQIGSGVHEAHGIGYVQMIHSQKLLEERATRDAVTGLLNRATVEERISETLQQTDAACFFFIFDVDNFKAVNDCAGHAEGDRVLKQIASVMRAHTRRGDLLGRVGGDEFVALLCGLPSREAALRRAREMLAAVSAQESPATWRGSNMLSLSAGMAASCATLNDYDSLYRAADRALYRAKGLGKNRCCAEPEPPG